MNGKKLTTDDKVFKARALSCPLCNGRGFIVKAIRLFLREHSVRYYDCPLCSETDDFNPVVGLRRGWGKEARKSVERLRKSYPQVDKPS